MEFSKQIELNNNWAIRMGVTPHKTFVAVFTHEAIFWGGFQSLEEAETAIAAWIEKNPAWKLTDFQTRSLPFGKLL